MLTDSISVILTPFLFLYRHNVHFILKTISVAEKAYHCHSFSALTLLGDRNGIWQDFWRTRPNYRAEIICGKLGQLNKSQKQ